MPLTDKSAAGLDDNGAPAASLFLDLGHALTSLLVRVVCGTYSNLVLDGTQAVQLNATLAAKTKKRDRERGRTGRGDSKIQREAGGGVGGNCYSRQNI